MNIGIIGCGHMGSAIAKALIAKRYRVLVSNPKKPGKKLKWTTDNCEVVKRTSAIFIAVRPSIVESVLKEIAPHLTKRHIIISIAAGIPLAKLKQWSKNHPKIARVMPNLPAQVCDGVSVWKTANGITKKEKTLLIRLLNSFSQPIEVRSEKLIDVATAISGSGPAYVAAFLESMTAVAEQNGFSKNDARNLALQTVDGALDYIEETGVGFSELKKSVQTKSGTTEAAFKVLRKKKWQRIFEEAMSAAYQRAQTLKNS